MSNVLMSASGHALAKGLVHTYLQQPSHMQAIAFPPIPWCQVSFLFRNCPLCSWKKRKKKKDHVLVKSRRSRCD